MFENIKTIYFDYDGTIHNSIKAYGQAFRKAYQFLVNKGVAQHRQWHDDEIAYWLGFSSKAMWKEFMPELDPVIINEASCLIGKEMQRLISNGGSVLYEGALETLTYLKQKGYQLVFISNCSRLYKDVARDTFKLDDYFEEMVCSEEFDYRPKHQILSVIKDKYANDMVIIGDRFQDIEAGLKNNILTIGCSYGFQRCGELEQADIIISDIKELMILL